MRHTADTITDDELDRLYAQRKRLVEWVADLADMPEGCVWEQLAEEWRTRAQRKPVAASGPRQPQESP